MIKTLIGTNADGSPRYNFTIEDSDLDENGEFHVVQTGRGMGLVQLEDGTLVDVTDPVVAVSSPVEAAEVAHQIGIQVERLDPTTQHTDCAHPGCNAPTTADDDPLSPKAREVFTRNFGPTLAKES